MILDTSGLLAALDASEPMHQPCARVLQAHDRAPIVSPFVMAEVDYLLRRVASAEVALSFISEVASGAYALAPFEPCDLRGAVEFERSYPDLGLGLADASILVLARRYGDREILTLDHRHFRAIRADPPLRLLPADVAV